MHFSALRHGAADYLPKPIDADMLRATFGRLARIKDAERRARDSERLASIGEMAAVLAHEGRGSLQEMVLGTAILTRQAKDQPELLETIHAIEKTQHSLTRLFEDLTCFACSLARCMRPKGSAAQLEGRRLDECLVDVDDVIH